MNSNLPKVSIGIPVYNGEKYIRRAINSVLAQTFSDFEVIISDNCSTDLTSKICVEFKNDQRIKYIKQEVNRGAGYNFPFVLSKAKGEYFIWLAYDDYWEPTFLEKNVRILDDNSNVVGSIGLVEFENENLTSENFIMKLKNIIKHKIDIEKYKHVHPAFGDYQKKTSMYLRFNQASFIYGLFRTEKLRKRWVTIKIASWDLVTLLSILKEGDFYVVDEVLSHRSSSGINSKSGLINAYKKNELQIKDLIFPYSSLAIWCMKNIGIKFYFKNLDWFLLLTIYGWRSILLELNEK